VLEALGVRQHNSSDTLCSSKGIGNHGRAQPSGRRALLLLVITLLLLFLVNLLTPLTGDVLASFAAAFQADYIGPFPENVYLSWNLRGIGYKYLLYGIYRIIAIGGSIEPRRFQVWAKLLYYAIFLSSSAFFFKLLQARLARLSLSWKTACAIFLVAVLAASHVTFLQAEEVAVFLALGMTSFALAPKRYLNFAAALFVPFLLAAKGVTVLYAGFPFLMLLGLGESFRSQLYRLTFATLVVGVVTILFYIYVIPQEITDLVNATYYQSSLEISLRSLRSFFVGAARASSHISILVPGAIALFVVSVLLVQIKQYRVAIALLTLYLLAATIVFIQGRFFPYHYHAFLIPSVVVIMAAMGLLHRFRLRVATVPVAVCSLYLMTVIFSVPGPVVDPYANAFVYTSDYYVPRRDAILSLEKRFHLSAEPSVLFLTGGIANFFLPVRSHLRYFYPLPLQRIARNEALRQTEVFQDTLARALEYRGKYVVITPAWFDTALIPTLARKLEEQYDVVYSYHEAGTRTTPLVLLERVDGQTELSGP